MIVLCWSYRWDSFLQSLFELLVWRSHLQGHVCHLCVYLRGNAVTYTGKIALGYVVCWIKSMEMWIVSVYLTGDEIEFNGKKKLV